MHIKKYIFLFLFIIMFMISFIYSIHKFECYRTQKCKRKQRIFKPSKDIFDMAGSGYINGVFYFSPSKE